MLNKIYLIALAVFVVGMCVLTYFGFDWLSSLTVPDDVKRNYEQWFRYGRIFLFVSSLILLILANVILWQTRQKWAFWTTLGYFVVFILVQTFWLNRAFVQYQTDKKLIEDTISFTPIIGVLMIITAAVVIYFNQFLVTRTLDKMFAKDSTIQELPDEEVEEVVAENEEKND